MVPPPGTSRRVRPSSEPASFRPTWGTPPPYPLRTPGGEIGHRGGPIIIDIRFSQRLSYESFYKSLHLSQFSGDLLQDISYRPTYNLPSRCNISPILVERHPASFFIEFREAIRRGRTVRPGKLSRTGDRRCMCLKFVAVANLICPYSYANPLYLN